MSDLTFAGYPIHLLGDLPDDTRRRLLRHLDEQCTTAAVRNAAILRARQARRHEAFLDAIRPDPPRVILARQLALLAETAPRRSSRHTTGTRLKETA